MNIDLLELKKFMITNEKMDSIKSYIDNRHNKKDIVNRDNKKDIDNRLNKKDIINKDNKKDIINKDNKKDIANRDNINFKNIDKLFYTFILKLDYLFEIDYSYIREKNMKIEYIEKLRNIKKKLKLYKIKLDDIENELLNRKFISITTIIGLCIFHEMNLMLVFNNKYYELLINDLENGEKKNLYIFKEKEKDDYKIFDESDNSIKEKIDNAKKNYLKLDYYNQSLKSVNSYSKGELLYIVKKLGILEITEKNNKKEIYEKILEKY